LPLVRKYLEKETKKRGKTSYSEESSKKQQDGIASRFGRNWRMAVVLFIKVREWGLWARASGRIR